MDNLEQDPSAASDQSAQGQSEVETQSQVDDNTQGQGDASTEAGAVNPWDSDHRFKGKSAEEVWRSYNELQHKLGSRNQESEVLKTLQDATGMTPQEMKQFIENRKQEQVQAQIQANPLAYVAEEVQQLKSQIAYQEEVKQLDAFIAQNPTMTPFRDKLLRLGMQLETDKSYEQIAQEYFAPAMSQGQQSAYTKMEQKNNTNITQAGGTSRKPITEEDMRNMSVAELEAILPHAQR